jgi:uncharacterized repeat protein (TIGR03803 family)
MHVQKIPITVLRCSSTLGALFMSALMGIGMCGGALAASTTAKPVYAFKGGSDGWYPSASMIADKNGNLYGTTFEGGASANCEGQGALGCGTVFELTPPAHVGGAWTETVLYTFQGSADGAFPEALMIFDQAGNLYGATSGGGFATRCSGGCGVIFELSPPSAPGGAWTETVLHLFTGVPSGQGNGDVAWPNNIVLGSDGDIYGMGYNGGHCFSNETGTHCYGAVFELQRPAGPAGAWHETILYIFKGPAGGPQSAIFDRSGNLYGSAAGGPLGFGVIFQLTPTANGPWTYNDIHDFRDAPDGAFVVNGLAMDPARNIYGATLGGGNGVPGDGSVFELQPPASQGGPWTESVLYTFANGTVGNSPATGPVLDRAGNLYGAVDGGGAFNFGAVYKLTPASGSPWTETILYNFLGGANGAAPIGGLNFGKFGALYGTTESGGIEGPDCKNADTGERCGLVFTVAP